LPDATGLVEAMKRAAKDEREASKPVNIYFGEVQSVKPLKINVEQKMVLGENQLVLTRNVTDYDTMVTMNWETESALHSHSHGDGTAVDLAHTHALSGQKQITIHNALEAGEQVILIRQQEGQKFVVLDRIGGSV
jgi:hypothetical protein